jgi:acetyl esterase/lipase
MTGLAEAGYAAVGVEYRLSHEAPFPAAVHDVKCAVRWLRANATVFNLDPDRFAAVGLSAGGYLACILGLTTPLYGFEGKGGFSSYPSDVQVVISYAGISDLAKWHKDGGFLAKYCVNRFMKDSPDKAPDLFKKANPISYARGDLAAVLLIHGTEDTIVPFKQSQEMEAALKAAKANVQLVPIKGADHMLTDDEIKAAEAAALKFLEDNFRSYRSGKVTEKHER